MMWFDMGIQEKCAFVCVCVRARARACVRTRTGLREGGKSVPMVFDRSFTFTLRSILIYRNIDVLQIDPLMLLAVN
jgi:hypothetical protein